MNKKGSPSHIILNCSGNYAGNKILKFPEREKVGKKKKKKSETTESGNRRALGIYQQQHQNLDANRTVISLHLLLRIIRQRDVEFHT